MYGLSNELLNKRIENFEKALKKLKQAFLVEPTELVIDGTLQRYEFTFELAWKTIKDYLEYNGIVSNIASPRNVIQQAYQSKIIKNGDIWIQMMLDRNLLSHLYDEQKSREIYENIKKKYLKQFDDFDEFLKKNS